MNLNEECLLQFLKNDLPVSPRLAKHAAGHAMADLGSLSADLQRIYRRNRFVSFPQAILIRRPVDLI